MSWPPAGHDRQRELFDDADPGPIEPGSRPECDHRADGWEVVSSTEAGAELEAECRRCGAELYGFIGVAEMDAVEERGRA